MTSKSFLSPLLNFVFPKSCSACSKFLLSEETILCTKCRNELPLIPEAFFTKTLVLQIFKKENKISNFSSLFFFEKGTEVQELIHGLKYKEQKFLGNFFGKWHVSILKNNPKYSTVEYVIPMPIHKKRLKKRTYNQVEDYAKEISKGLKIKLLKNILVKNKHKGSQVFLNREDRFENILDSLEIKNPEIISNKHILIVDDLITTGATMQACIKIFATYNCIISIASIALVDPKKL